MIKKSKTHTLTKYDTFEEKATDCGCSHKTTVQPEIVAETESPKCLPWVKIERDPNKFRACLVEAQKIGRMDDSKKFYELIKEHMITEDQEVFYVVLLDTQLFVRGITEIARGARDRTLTPIPDILRVPVVDGATAFLVAHNHPSGKCNPSKADKQLTKDLKKAADIIGIPLFDHIVVGANDYYSFADHGEL